MTIGFTGTRRGMTTLQAIKVGRVLAQLLVEHPAATHEAHHGVCVGADAEFHHFARDMGCTIVGHPGVARDGTVVWRADVVCDRLEPAKFFLDRNVDIVRATEVLLAAPGEIGARRGSGTWATIRHARRAQKWVIIFWPDGRISEESAPPRA